jgi:hypothetical protein
MKGGRDPCDRYNKIVAQFSQCEFPLASADQPQVPL